MKARVGAKLLLVAVIIVVVSTVSCLGSDAVKWEEQSSAGTYKARLVEGDSGAVGSWISVVQLSVSHPGLWQALAGPEWKTVFGADFRSDHISLKWKADKNLEILCRDCDRRKIDVQDTAWRDVAV